MFGPKISAIKLKRPMTSAEWEARCRLLDSFGNILFMEEAREQPLAEERAPFD